MLIKDVWQERKSSEIEVILCHQVKALLSCSEARQRPKLHVKLPSLHLWTPRVLPCRARRGGGGYTHPRPSNVSRVNLISLQINRSRQKILEKNAAVIKPCQCAFLFQARFIRRIPVASNAIQTIDNEISCRIRRDGNSTCKTGLISYICIPSYCISVILFLLQYVFVFICRNSCFVQITDPEYESLSSFLHSYLERRFGAENLTFEWAYNLQDACVRYQHDPRIGLFYGILSDEVRNS